MLMSKMSVQPILPITVLVREIKDAACQRRGDGDGVARCEETFNLFDVTCKQHHRTALNPILNGTKKATLTVRVNEALEKSTEF